MFRRLFNNLKAWFLKEQFNPSIFGLFLNPFYFARREIWKNIKIYSKKITGITLDIGCGCKPYINLFSFEKYIGMDVEISGHNRTNEKIDVFYDGVTIPFNDEYFDSIVCFEVLEHVFNPEVFLKEANRVLKRGGVALFTVPFIWDEHEVPFDFARYSSFGLEFLFEKNGFVVSEKRKYLCDLRLLSLLTNTYIYKIIKRLIPYQISFFLILPLTTLNNILGHLFYLLPESQDMYFGNIFLLIKPDKHYI